jgi:glycerol uptake facilitator-like aquaporin
MDTLAAVNGVRPNITRRALAEALAAFALVFAGCGAIAADARYDGALGAVGVGLVFGLVIMVLTGAALGAFAYQLVRGEAQPVPAEVPARG